MAARLRGRFDAGPIVERHVRAEQGAAFRAAVAPDDLEEPVGAEYVKRRENM